ncbi:MAG: hypothetical protein JWO86_8649 [Myxococcaceae bacterium]|nr:hypothetical protein [Myxococcaceae bacterium]
MSRDGDRFVFDLAVQGPRTSDDHGVVVGRVETRGLDADEIVAAVASARGTFPNAEVRPHLIGWASRSFDARAAEVRRLFPDAQPTVVAVARTSLSSERGEEATGQPNVRLDLRFSNGALMSVVLERVMTDERDHDATGDDFVARGTALAKALGVACEIT